MNGAGLGNYVSLSINIATIICYLLMPIAMGCSGVGTGNKYLFSYLSILKYKNFLFLILIYFQFLIYFIVASTESSQTKGLTRSVAVLVFIVAGCWMSSIAFRSFAPQMFPVMNIAFFTTGMAWGEITGASQSANAFVLYTCRLHIYNIFITKK
jgi:hypothetical protein